MSEKPNEINNEINNDIYNVSAFLKSAKNLLEERFQWIRIVGEVSNLTRASSGHWYFSLKDQDAQVRCAFFKQSQRRLNFNPSNGQEVMLLARVSLYEARGDFQLIVMDMQMAGEGALQLAFLAMKARLEKDGLFDPARKKTLPSFPQRIGIITSPSTAALRDFIHVTARRAPPIQLIIYPCLVQGSDAAQQIANAIGIANRRREVDVLVLTRGGGSLEDLWAFNEEVVAQAMAASQLPIVSAVGHETDFTIADFVSDCRAATPSAAAEILTPDRHALLRNWQQLSRQLQQSMQHALSLRHMALAHLKQRLRHPDERLSQFNESIHALTHKLQGAINLYFKQHERELAYLSERLKTLSPLNTLSRGYAIVFDANPGSTQIIRQTTEVRLDQSLRIQLVDGSLAVRVIDKHPEPEPL